MRGDSVWLAGRRSFHGSETDVAAAVNRPMSETVNSQERYSIEQSYVVL